MIFKAITLLALAALAAAKNPKVVSPQALTYNAGDVMEIQWSEAETGFLNIDIVGDNGVLPFPMMIAAGVPGQAGKYTWKIPAELKSAANYNVRVWGDHQPASTDDGMSQKFTILNNIPNAINTFTVVSPNPKAPCVAGETCQITWDYSVNGMYPAMVDIALYRVGNPEPIMSIATVSSSLKSFNWAVPNDPALMSGEVYVSVSGQGTPMAGPGMSNDMGGNSPAFAVSAAQANGEEKPKKDLPKKKAAPKKPEPKVEGKAAKDKNAASQVSATVGILSTVLAMTLFTMYL